MASNKTSSTIANEAQVGKVGSNSAGHPKTSSLAYKFSPRKPQADMNAPKTGSAAQQALAAPKLKTNPENCTMHPVAQDSVTKHQVTPDILASKDTAPENEAPKTSIKVPAKASTKVSTKKSASKQTVAKKTEPTANRVTKSSAKSAVKPSIPAWKNPNPLTNNLAVTTGNLWDDIRAGRRRTLIFSALRDDWLTDNNISFWEEWLEREVLPKYPEARIILMRPSISFLLMQSMDLKAIGSALPNFNKVTHIFLPVNDCRQRNQADGGSHWSLLLVSCIDGVAFHYDSLGGANFLEAQKCADRLGKVIGQALRFHQMDDCPQQANGSDCGVFVCILMRHLLIKRLLNANANEKVSMSMANKMIDSKGGRKEMLKIIDSLRKEGERRRSASPYPSTNTPPRIE
ncbi:hypothetical protein B0T16DRAFT_385670 [Cercophora newfieldiana]|uniref:Ubiquitin-like protease family profile domain-containing protein n=1 Tax=Cercophora newfieldiana TaxID=92897 RepID=A0AA39YR10_9PEZI|nr:hypothetical protein B0T16DRAFT_385670 [Cercophora newfieldiana]